MSEARERRLVFGEVAERHDRARPDHPAATFEPALTHSESSWSGRAATR